MKMPRATHWEGIFSLIWVLAGAGCFHLHAIRYNGYGFDPIWLFYFIVMVVWWGIGFSFAISASKRGSPLNVLCGRAAILLICFYIFFVAFIIPRVHA
jgi:hypothetical protein